MIESLDKIAVYEYTDNTREDEEGILSQWRIEQFDGKWHLTMWDSYHGDWYVLPKRKSSFDTLEEAEADLETVLQEGLTLY